MLIIHDQAPTFVSPHGNLIVWEPLNRLREQLIHIPAQDNVLIVEQRRTQGQRRFRLTNLDSTSLAMGARFNSDTMRMEVTNFASIIFAFSKMQGEFEKMQRGANCNRAKSDHFSITCIASPYSRSRETVLL
jgi:hypothetical protein